MGYNKYENGNWSHRLGGGNSFGYAGGGGKPSHTPKPSPKELKAADFAEKQYHIISSDNIDEYLQHVLDNFRIKDRLDLPVCPVQEHYLAGNFWNISKEKLNNEKNISANTLFYDGIDQQGLGRTSIPILRLLDGLGLSPAAYVYNAPLSQMRDDYVAMAKDRDHFSSQHSESARIIANSWNDNKKRFNHVRYSNGVSFGKALDNGIVEIFADELKYDSQQIKDYFSNQRILTVGIPIRESESAKEVQGIKLAEYQKSAKEIGLFATVDHLPYISGHIRNICAKMENHRMGFDKNFIIFSHSDSEDKISIIARSNVVNNSVNINGQAAINIGGHRFQNYFATFGLIEDKKTSLSKDAIKLGEIIKSYLSGELEKDKKTLVQIFKDNGFEVIKFDKEKHALKEIDIQKVEEAMIETYQEQAYTELKLLGDKHPLLGNPQNIHKKH